MDQLTNNLEAFHITTPSDREIVMTRGFDAPRSYVFEAWTRAEHVKQWWDPSGAPLAVCEIDLRPNGAFRWINSGASGMEHPFTGVYREISAPERLVFTVGTGEASPQSAATILFREERGKTMLTITIKCESKEDRDALLRMRIDAGTAQTLENLAEYLLTYDTAGR
jgi:uncharacterized protein YndB with AHSA1/START domain